MKLVELLSEEKTIIKEQTISIPRLTTLSADGIDYQYDGSKWINVADNTPAPRNVASQLTNNFRLLNPGNPVFDRNTIPVAVKNRFLVNLADETYSFARQADADKFLSRLRSGSTTERALSIFSNDDFRRIGRGLWSTFSIGVTMTATQIDDAVRRSNWVSRIFANPMIQGFFRLLGILGINIALYQTFIINYDQVRNTPESDFEGGAAEKEELLDVITGLFVSQSILVLSMAFRMLRAATLINLIRTPIRAIQAGIAATGGGAPLALISMIITEAAFWGATYLITRPAVQMNLAKYISNTVASSIFEGVGNAADIAAVTLDTITNGAFGGATLRDALTFEGGVRKMPEGTAFASSEWAKIAFQDSIFPPDMEKIKIPYLILGDRSPAIFAALDIDPSEIPSDSLNPRPVSSGYAGSLSEYVFPYTPELADRLQDTHELIVINDRMGAVPGGANQELYLAPTQAALSSGNTIPMPDNRILTRTGARIEREPETVTPVDTIVSRASAAIDAAETPADRSNVTRQQSLQTDYSNPNVTRAQPVTGPR